MSYESGYENALCEMFPDSRISGTISRKQILTFMDASGIKKWPTWIMKDAVSRGVYKLHSIKNIIPFKEVDVSDEEYESETTSITPIKHIPVSKFTDDMETLIPAIDKNYVPFGNHKDIDLIIKSGMFYPTYVAGQTGNGKSTMVEQVCAVNKRALVRVNLNMMTDEDQLIAAKTLVDGNVQIVEGPVLVAMRTGAILLLDEIDAGGANTLLCLQPILEGKPYYFKLNNELITPTPGFNIFATANTKGKGSDDGRYIGTNVLNEAFLERFAVTLNQEYPSATIEKRIISNLMKYYSCYDQEYSETLAKWADAIRRTFDDGGVDELITTRRLTHVVRAFSIFKNKKKAVELCCNRFDDITRIAFIDLYEKISADPSEAAEKAADEPILADELIPF